MLVRGRLNTHSRSSVSLSRPSPSISSRRCNSTLNDSVWQTVTQGPEDPILGVTIAYNKDTSPIKINLGAGAYRDDQGKPFVLECVKKAEKKIAESNPDHEYGPINGLPSFTKAAAKLQFGSSYDTLAPRTVSIQALSGTGALRVGGDYMKRFINLPGDNKKSIFLPNPTWGNHIPLFTDAGLTPKTYKYYNDKTCGLDFDGMKADIKAAPNSSLFLFHACAHNPTGVDPNLQQWKELSKICLDKGHFVFFDCAYQGFASGNPEKDVAPVHQFITDGHNVGISQSFAKNFGLYGERVGALHFVCKDAAEAQRMESQLKILVRPMYSNPPVYGAKIVATVLGDTQLSAQWRTEVKVMADRIISMRQKLVDNLKTAGSKRDWTHITNQIGMFCYSGMTPEQVDRLASEFHVYGTRNGRISVAGITSGNVEHLAKSMHAVTK